jgi:hypothetical protein
MSHAHLCPVPVVCGLPGQIVSTFLSAFVGWISSAASWLLDEVGHALDTTTRPPVTTSWFEAKQRAILVVAAPIALLALLGSALHALLHGTVGTLVRTVLLRLPAAAILGAAAAGVVGLAVSATDQVCAALSSGDSTSISSVLHALATSVTTQPASVPAAVAVVMALVAILGSLCLWIDLIVRSAAITVATALLPLVFAASIWPPGVAWARRLVETLAALIVSKAVIVLVLSIALDAVVHEPQGVASVVTGGALLLLAAFAPFVVLRLVPSVEAAAVSHLEGVRRRAVSASTQVAGRAATLAAGIGPTPLPGVDPIGTDPIGMMPGVDVDLVAGTPLDPTMKFTKGPRPLKAIPASTGTHRWERDRVGPRLVWHPAGDDLEDDADAD